MAKHGMHTQFKFNKAADAKARKAMLPQFGADPEGGVVRAGAFAARREAQIRLRKAKERRVKIAAMRAKY